jgi:hypothetical protein
MRSVPPRGSGWVVTEALYSEVIIHEETATHPLPRGGTDLISKT